MSFTKFTVAVLLVLFCFASFSSAKGFHGPKATKCLPRDRKGDVCPMIYAPVCGHKPDIVCITTPCNYITYSNACEACHDADVKSYTQGECPEPAK